MLKTKLIIAVETYTDYKYSDEYSDNTTFEIFESLKEAQTYINHTLVEEKIHDIWIADFNTKYIFKENNGLNYSDNADLYKNKRSIPINLFFSNN